MAAAEPILKRLAGPAAMAAANAVIVTVGVGKRWLLKQAIFVNTNATTTRIVQVAKGTSATAANRFITVAIPPGDTAIVNLAMVLEAAETIEGNQGTGTDVTATFVGVEQQP